MQEDYVGAQLVGQIAEALRRHLPHGCTVSTVRPGCVEYVSKKGSVVTDVQQMLHRGDFLTAGYNILSAVQDEVQTDTTDPWPAWSEGLAMPQARLSVTHLRLWYGSESVIALFVVDCRL